MYRFQTADGTVFETAYSPKEISKLIHFDAFDLNGNSFVLSRNIVNFFTFEYIIQ